MRMNRFSVAALALALLMGSSVVMADDAAATGSITGKVLDAKGEPAPKVTVTAKVAKVKGAPADPAVAAIKPMTTTTGDDGAFKFDKVPVGSFGVSVKDATLGNGKVKGKVDVVADKPTDVGTINLKVKAGA